MTNEEQQIIKAMILENEKDVVVIKQSREYTNLGVLQAKKVYEKKGSIIILSPLTKPIKTAPNKSLWFVRGCFLAYN